MLKRKVASLDRSKATAKGSLNYYQSVWMAHWKAAKPPPRHKSNFLSLNSETRESDSSSGQEVTSSPSDMPKMDRQLCKVSVKSTVNVKAVATNAANIVDGTAVAMFSQNSSYQEPVSAQSMKNDTQLSKRGQIFRESTIHTNHEGNGTFGQFLSLSMNGNYHGNPSIKLQLLWSLTDSEVHENPAKGSTSAVALKNKSSAETNTLDIDALPKKRLTGEASSFTKKEPSSGNMVKFDLRDRKRKFLALATTSSFTKNGKPSPSAKDGASTSVDNTNAEKGRCALLSDPWIRRWCHDQAAALPGKKEPFGTKTFDERQKKQMPSVAAIALMGKAMNGFHPCELKRRGSFIMWNS